MKKPIKIAIGIFALLFVALFFTIRFEKPPEPLKAAAWHFPFATVRAYQLNWADQFSFDSILGKDGLNETRMPMEGVLLSNEQIEALRVAILNREEGGVIAMCRYPHHAFVFFDDDGQVTGHYDVCFLCSNAGGSPEGFSGFPYYNDLNELFTSLGMPITNPEWD